MLKIGLTGSMGSGKTTVSNVFESMKIPVFNADEKAKGLYNCVPELKKDIKKRFGGDVYDTNDNLIPEKLANIVFFSPDKLVLLNAIIHPLVIREFENWSNNINEKNRYVIKEAALLFESNANVGLDKVICVVCPIEIRVKRIKKRNPALTEIEIRKRIEQQLSEKIKAAKSDFIICNDEVRAILPQILKLHEIFMKMCKGEGG